MSDEPKRRTRTNGTASRQPLDMGLNRLRAFSVDKSRQAAGVFSVLFSIYLLLAFISHLIYAGAADQSVLQAYSDQTALNSGGYFGAWFSNLFITEGFGLISLLLPPYFFLLGYALMENRFWELVRFTYPFLLFSLYWFSASLAFIKLVFDLPFTDLGGGLGLSINHWLALYVGRVGTGMLLIFSLLLFLQVKFGAKLKLFSKVGQLLARWDQSIAPPETFHDLKQEEPQSTAPEPPADDIFFVRRPVTAEPEPKESFNRDSLDSEDESPIPQVESPVEEPEELSFEPISTPLKRYKLTEEEADWHAESVGPSVSVGDTNQIGGVKTASSSVLISEPSLNFEINVAKGDEELDFFEAKALDQQRVQITPDWHFDLKARNSLLPFEAQDHSILNARPSLDRDGTFQLDIQAEDQEIELQSGQELRFEAYDPTQELSTYQLPTLELLNPYESPNLEVDEAEKKANMARIQTALGHYGVEIQRITATVGPTITLYEIVPAPGVRISKIKNLEDDIALNLSAQGIRIIAPMPGKGTIGIEIPNSRPSIVPLRNVIATEKFRDSTAELPIALGRTISNEVFMSDLTKMPHLLVAGATGQGKSVGLNSIIASILYKKHPSQVKFVLIDPKKVEMSLYQALEQHFLAKLPGLDESVITDNLQVIRVLNSLCIEMDQRYELLKEARVRHILEYNDKFRQRRLNPQNGHRFLPYIVVIIDELADLMLTAGKEIEAPITRLAQLARAIGIHLVLATQRPSVNVITGIIKANFPVRISYRVMQKVDSRTILDANGAEQLVGKGDLLVSINGEISRVQNAFIDTPEVERIVDWISRQRGYPEPYWLPEVPDEKASGEDIDPSDRDPLFIEAARLLVRLQTGSTSAIQQHLGIGYPRASRITLQLERAGIVGRPSGANKPRELLVHTEAELEQYL
jgi:S-DNA-T family DNA segregation ATPase FtsK/SpoIIIE